MTSQYNAARMARRMLLALMTAGRRCRGTGFAFFLALLIVPSAFAGLRQPDNTPLKQFGFATGPNVNSPSEVQRYYDVTKKIVGAGGIVRTGLSWDPTVSNVPDFNTWSNLKLQSALARGLVILPRISTDGPGGFRIPSDSQWTQGLAQIVRMYAPGGIYRTGGTYMRNGKVVKVSAHPDFKGLTDFELWNEPDSRGSVNGTMTYAKIAHLLKIGSIAMRAEAAKLGVKLNIIGPAFDGIEVADVNKLWMADNSIFNYIDTLSLHAYSRLLVTTCDSNSESVRCIKNLEPIRKFLDSHGGKHVHIGNSEGGYAGSTDSCLGPQVLTESLQMIYSEAALVWIRNRPGLDVDFWVTYQAIDGTRKYGYECDSGKYDNEYWKQKLGVVRADLSLKPWGFRLMTLMNSWR